MIFFCYFVIIFFFFKSINIRLATQNILWLSILFTVLLLFRFIQNCFSLRYFFFNFIFPLLFLSKHTFALLSIIHGFPPDSRLAKNWNTVKRKRPFTNRVSVAFVFIWIFFFVFVIYSALDSYLIVDVIRTCVPNLKLAFMLVSFVCLSRTISKYRKWIQWNYEDNIYLCLWI